MYRKMYYKQIIKFIRFLIVSILKHNIGALAAVIAFFGFSSMIPLTLLLVYGASIFIPHTLILHFISDVLRTYVPTIPNAQYYLLQNLSRLDQIGSKVGIFGLIGLLWTSIGGFVSFQQILDVIWGIKKRRSFIKQYLVGFGMLCILLSLTILTALATMLLPIIIENILVSSHILSWLSIAHYFSDLLFPLLLYITCYFCYRFLPSHPLRNRYLLIGALISTVGIYVSRELFVFYTFNLGRYEMVYGSLTFIMLFTFWFYIVSMIVLFGAETAVALRDMRELNPEK